MEIVTTIAEWCATLIELLGVVLITGTALFSLGTAVWQCGQNVPLSTIYSDTRQRLGRGLLLGLELLVAADIIHTAAVDFQLETVGVLAIIVVIRTLLSFTLEVAGKIDNVTDPVKKSYLFTDKQLFL